MSFILEFHEFRGIRAAAASGGFFITFMFITICASANTMSQNINASVADQMEKMMKRLADDIKEFKPELLDGFSEVLLKASLRNITKHMKGAMK